MIRSGNFPPEQLHGKAMLFVTAAAQSAAVENMLPYLSELETEVYKRGRNAKGRIPKSVSATEYRRATGMECLFGYLHLAGEKNRIEELFALAFGEN